MEKKKKKKKRWLSNLLILLVFLIGFGILAYPTVSDMWNKYRNAQLITRYKESVQTLSEEDYSEVWKEAKEYNKKHKQNNLVAVLGEETDYEMDKEYESVLNPNGDGLMGSIDIPKIGERIAIYHGLGSNVLEKGCGHAEGTSLPIGGTSTHAALAAHRGLPSAKLFTDLDQMEVGDIFIINILNEKLAYQVDQIKTVLPEQVEDIAIVDGEDYVTLITCTPYGVNTHRLLVRGTRVEYVPEIMEPEETMPEKIAQIHPMYFLIGGLCAFMIIVIILYFSIKRKKEAKHEEDKKNHNQ